MSSTLLRLGKGNPEIVVPHPPEVIFFEQGSTQAKWERSPPALRACWRGDDRALVDPTGVSWRTPIKLGPALGRGFEQQLGRRWMENPST
ncbi:hypothetical protein VMCG_00019 [Cytospora schulzeri]|uniref:Uncharacterized protein n=1 Tax=Cytospora schulzeri TaxID=448051 RepID=A0A423X9G9_9PEZI|nr:hypothetical protein VMCG_00019 [Valsa malicola]